MSRFDQTPQFIGGDQSDIFAPPAMDNDLLPILCYLIEKRFQISARLRVCCFNRHSNTPLNMYSRNVHIQRSVRMAIETTDRKSTRLNSSHQIISYAVF